MSDYGHEDCSDCGQGSFRKSTRADDELCSECGRHYHEHHKERVQHEIGTYSYEYICPQ